MSEAAPDRSDEMLAELAELDLALARKVQAAALAAEGPNEVADLARAYQRVARSLRQTLALKAKLQRDRAAAAPPARPAPAAPDPHDLACDRRVEALDDAVGRVIAATYPQSPERQSQAWYRFDREVDDWLTDEDFPHRPLEAHVAEVCARLGLPADLAARWRELPSPDHVPDPLTWPEAAVLQPRAYDTG